MTAPANPPTYTY